MGILTVDDVILLWIRRRDEDANQRWDDRGYCSREDRSWGRDGYGDRNGGTAYRNDRRRDRQEFDRRHENGPRDPYPRDQKSYGNQRERLPSQERVPRERGEVGRVLRDRHHGSTHGTPHDRYNGGAARDRGPGDQRGTATPTKRGPNSAQSPRYPKRSRDLRETRSPLPRAQPPLPDQARRAGRVLPPPQLAPVPGAVSPYAADAPTGDRRRTLSKTLSPARTHAWGAEHYQNHYDQPPGGPPSWPAGSLPGEASAWYPQYPQQYFVDPQRQEEDKEKEHERIRSVAKLNTEALVCPSSPLSSPYSRTL